MLSQYGWPLYYAAMLLVGIALALTLLALSRPKLLRIIGTLPYCSPNWLSVWRLPVVAIGQLIFLTAGSNLDLLWTGFLISVAGLTFDRIDGKVAESLLARLRFLPDGYDLADPAAKISQIHYRGPLTAQNEIWVWYAHTTEDKDGNKQTRDRRVVYEEWMRNLTSHDTVLPMFHLELDPVKQPQALRLHLTGMGEWLDPHIDKFNILPLLIYTAWVGALSPAAVIPMVLVDLFSAIMRKPFDRVPLINKLHQFSREAKAGPLGKSKFAWEFFSLLIVAPTLAGWLKPEEARFTFVAGSLVLCIGVLTGLLGVITRLTLMNYLLSLPGLRRFNHNFKKAFEHEVE
jgi:phosphatidylglycerophosphate synthase